MSRAKELAVVVAQARRDIFNRSTVRQCRAIYQAIMEQAEQGAKLGAYKISGPVELDPNEKYDFLTICNQMRLKLELEEFEDVLVSTGNLPDELFFSFTIPEVEVPTLGRQEELLEF